MTTTPDFRSLCAELVNELHGYKVAHPMHSESLVNRARAALATPSGPPKNCWLDDEPDLCPSHCVFDDPSEVISNCTYAQSIKCKTDCQYYRVATPPTKPPTDDEILKLTENISPVHLYKHESLPSDWDFGDYACSPRGLIDIARAVLERWGK